MLRMIAAVLLMAPPARAQSHVSPLTLPVRESVVPARSGTAPHGRLKWTMPCEFAYADGAPFDGKIEDYHCDYLLASLREAHSEFAKMPTLQAQVAFLSITAVDAGEKREATIKKLSELLQSTALQTVPEDLSTGDQLKTLNAYVVRLSSQGPEACKPFLWPKYQGGSFLSGDPGYWPSSWQPCLGPLYPRFGELLARIKVLGGKAVDRAALSAVLRATAIRAAREKAGLTPEVGFDGAAARRDDAGAGAGAARAEPSAGAATAVDPKTGAAPVLLQARVQTERPLPSDAAARERRNYFARGYEAGFERLKSEARLVLWHATGETATVGDPYGKAQLNISQIGPTCGVAAQYQALRARGIDVDLPALTKESFDKGYYVEYPVPEGPRMGGVLVADMVHLLEDHGVRASLVRESDSAALASAVRRSGDAIVFVDSRRLWNDQALPDGAAHYVYVTGAEIARNGGVRGFYINDSASGGEAARFIPLKDFARAWGPFGNKAIFIEPKS